MKTVVVGGSGFIGSHLCDLLCEDPQVTKVLNYDRKAPPFPTQSPKYQFVPWDIAERHPLQTAFEGAEEIYNMASLLGTAEMFNRMVESVRVNVFGGVQVLDVAQEMGVARVCWPTKADKWPNMYTATKTSMEIFVKLYQEHFGLRICVLEPWNLYGPRQTLYPVRKYFPTLAAQAIVGRPLTIYGDGTHVARISHVETAARISIAACRKNDDALGFGARTLHICGPAKTINEIARDILAATETDTSIDYLPMREGQGAEGLPEPPADALQTEARLGITPIAWEKGCPETVEWYRENYTEKELVDALAEQDEFVRGQQKKAA